MLSLPTSFKSVNNAVNNVDAKQLLRAQVDRLPVEKQLEFIDFALHLIENRTCHDGRFTGDSTALVD